MTRRRDYAKCPFCGSYPHDYIVSQGGVPMRYGIRCQATKCGVQPKVEHVDGYVASARWEKRA